MVNVNLVSILIASVAILPAYAFRPTNPRVSVATRSTLRLSSADSEAFDPLHLGTSSTKSHTSSSSSVAAATAAVSALLVPTQEAFAKGGEYGILEGRTGSMAHPITMFALFGTSIYSAYLGLKYRELRTIGDSIKEAQRGYPQISSGNVKYPVADVISSTKTTIAASEGGDVSSLEKDLSILMSTGVAEVDKQVGELITKRKSLTGMNLRDKHHASGSILLGVGISLTILGCMNTYMRAGKLFPGPHLFAGAAICGAWAISSACVSEMQKGNEAARAAHIGLNFLTVGLFAWQVSTGIPIMFKVIEFTKFP